MAIYNTGRYLDDSIGSLINQTIGFQKIQLILVNDGSTDETKEICQKYLDLYPKNIIYIENEHAGVSRARNIGLTLVKGKYVNFLDPDDLWNYDAFQYVIDFYKIYSNVNLVAGRLKFFEAKDNYHILDFKFSKTRVINLTKDYTGIQLSASSCFFRSKILKQKKFKEGIIAGEDIRFVNTILLTNPLIGVIKEAVYNYRSRADGTSTIQQLKKQEGFYFDTLIHVHHYLIKLSIMFYEEIIPFIQYYLAYDILLRIRTPSHKNLNLIKYIKYRSMIKNILKKIDDIYILEQRHVSNAIKLLALSKKYEKDLREEIIFVDGTLKYSGRTMINLSYDKNVLYWRILDIKNGILHLEGKDNCWMDRKKYFYFCKVGETIYYPKYEDYIHYDLNSLYGIVVKGRTVSFDIPLRKIDNQVIYVYISYLGNISEVYPTLGYFSHIPTIPEGYFVSEGFIVKQEERRLNIYKYSKELENEFETKYCEQLKLEEKEYLIPLRKKAIKYRNKIKNKKKEIWLINDRPNQAGDNGEYFFKYLNENKKDEIDAYFVILENCTDYDRLKNVSNVLPLGSDEYLEMFLKADKIVSSMCNSWVDNPFGDDRIYIYDLFHFDYIFLQHGISKDDVSHFLHRLNKNFTMIITASKKEYRSMLSPNYGYNPNSIKLTGFARYDNLQHYKEAQKYEKMILIIPTWRMNIKGTVDSLTGKSIHSHYFKDTQFFAFYDNLINDPRLIHSMKKLNYTGVFCLHPTFSAQWVDFRQNSQFIIQDSCNYQELLSKASLLVTDYSSVFFDFAYMRKPIIYTQFDYEEYRKYHYQNGYFNYLTDGFGPVYTDIFSSVDAIIDAINNNCPLKKKYLRKIQSFFAFSDEHNNDRIYQQIYGISHPSKDENFKGAKFYSSCLYLFIISLFFFYKLDQMSKDKTQNESEE